MSIYLIGAIDIEDRAIYAQYEVGANASIVGTATQPLAVDEEPIVLEGKSPGRRVVLLKFDDEVALRNWYSSERYQTAMQNRLKAAKTNFLIAIRGLPGI